MMPSVSTSRSLRRLLAPAGAMLAGALILAPAPVQSQDLPAADDLIAAYVEAMGGAERLRGVSSTTRGTLGLPAMGLEGDFTMYQVYPNQLRLDAELPGIGAIQSGYTGEVGWNVDPMMGPQLMEGAQLEQMREQASVAANLREASAVPGRETVGEAEFEGIACWRVRLTWASGRESHDCFAKDTGLLVASESTQTTAMGDMPSTSIYLDYREFDGRVVSTRMILRVAGQEQVMSVSEVTFGEVDPARVAPPAAIQALIGS
jgi:hypothetical protein